ncbi:E3 ubiquitin/ISG15 ligase TRIM25-like [Acipenser oxyrinchus oxyrinchus]|uniref:E3 ubiquitin/ISG15 ligase TRIM25-like n=1 Tax=Acipenser oxyrinchus oxyrinchus TaxID=40147 RepID=A0AAD8FPH8_ACIOX|nr:E3 ubiquitin/ISG15 ligase TRIM25-like [Acipenser oxyrinchus oxyrinchus]
MAYSNPESLFQEELSCPICLQLFSEPAVLPCGHNFCASCIEGVIEQEAGRGQHTCPECLSEYKGKAALQRNFQLCSIVEGFKASESPSSPVLCDMCLETPHPAVRTCLKCEISMCALHLKPHLEKKTFESHTLVEPTSDLGINACPVYEDVGNFGCSEGKSCACISCTIKGKLKKKNLRKTCSEMKGGLQSKIKIMTEKLNLSQSFLEKGRIHGTSVKAASVENGNADHPELKVDLESEILKKIHLAESLLQKGEKNKASVKVSSAELKRNVSGLFDRIAQLVCTYKEKMLNMIEEEQCYLVGSLERSTDYITKQQHLCKEIQQQGDSILAETDQIQFIQKYQQIQTKLKAALETPLNEKDVTSQAMHNKKLLESLERTFVEFQAEIRESRQDLKVLIYPSELTLDPHTAHCSLSLSEDLKTVRYTATKQPYPQLPERFDHWRQVLCFQGFSSGEHYWEVDAGEGFWHVGICYRSMARKGSGTDSKLGCNKASWTVELHGKLSAWHKNVCTRLEVSTQPARLGVHLNYDAGTLTFLNVSDKQTHLHTFRARFTEPVYPAFWIQSGTATSWITVRSTTDRDFRTYANIN